MRVPPFVPALTSLLLALPVSATFDCTFTIHTHKFDLSPLSGLHTVWKTDSTPPSIENTTIFVDLCQDLKWDDKVYPVDDRCKDGTQGIGAFLYFSTFVRPIFLVSCSPFLIPAISCLPILKSLLVFVHVFYSTSYPLSAAFGKRINNSLCNKIQSTRRRQNNHANNPRRRKLRRQRSQPKDLSVTNGRNKSSRGSQSRITWSGV